jgi:hypothetical protein
LTALPPHCAIGSRLPRRDGYAALRNADTGMVIHLVVGMFKVLLAGKRRQHVVRQAKGL